MLRETDEDVWLQEEAEGGLNSVCVERQEEIQHIQINKWTHRPHQEPGRTPEETVRRYC